MFPRFLNCRKIECISICISNNIFLTLSLSICLLRSRIVSLEPEENSLRVPEQPPQSVLHQLSPVQKTLLPSASTRGHRRTGGWRQHPGGVWHLCPGGPGGGGGHPQEEGRPGEQLPLPPVHLHAASPQRSTTIQYTWNLKKYYHLVHNKHYYLSSLITTFLCECRV